MSILSKLRHFACDVLDWHTPGESEPREVWFGTTHDLLCQHCRRVILGDSQGNWFSSPHGQVARRPVKSPERNVIG